MSGNTSHDSKYTNSGDKNFIHFRSETTLKFETMINTMYIVYIYI